MAKWTSWGQWNSLILLFRLLLLVVGMVTHIRAKTFKWYCAALWCRLVFIIIDHTALDPRHSILGRLHSIIKNDQTGATPTSAAVGDRLRFNLSWNWFFVQMLCDVCMKPDIIEQFGTRRALCGCRVMRKGKKLVKDDWPRELCSENKTSIICWEMMKNWNSSGDDEEKKQRVCVT